ncbi:unnamed protein product, partial [Chrysoparadoxa australica]
FAQVSVKVLSRVAKDVKSWSSCHAALRVAAIIVMDGVPVGGEVPAWLSPLAMLQAEWLECAMATANKKGSKSAVHAFQGLLSKRPDLASQYITVYNESQTKHLQALALAATACISHAPDVWAAQHKQQAVELYIQEALMVKGGLSDSSRLDSFKPLLGSLTEEDFLTHIQPVLEKLLKKNPDSVLPAVRAMVEGLRIDLSGFVRTALLAPLLRQLKSPKEEVRAGATALCKPLVLHVGDMQVLKEMVLQLLDVLAGKSGVLAQYFQRCSVLTALDCTCQAAGKAGCLEELTPQVVDVLVAVVEKESHESTRALALDCLVRWLDGTAVLPDKVFASLRKGIGHSAKPTAAAYLAALWQLPDDQLGGAQLKELVPALQKRIEEAQKKVAVFHPDALLSAGLLFSIDKEAFPEAIISEPSSFLYPSSALGVYLSAGAHDPATCAPLAALCKLLVLSFCSFLSLIPPTPQQAKGSLCPTSCVVLVQCALHPAEGVRAAALAAMRYSLSQCHLFTPLRTAQLFLQHMALELMHHKICLKHSTNSGSSKPKLPPPSRIAATLLASLGASAGPSCFMQSLLLSHNPLVGHSGKGAKKLLVRVLKAFGGSAAVADSLMEDPIIYGEAIDLIEASLLSPVASEKQAGLWSLCTLGSDPYHSELVKDVVLQTLLPKLQDSALLEVSKEEAVIFRTREGILCFPVGATKGNSAAQASKNASRRGRDAEEVEWEERMRKELAAKKGAGPSALSPEDQAQLMKESKVREKVTAVEATAAAALLAVEQVCTKCGAVGQAVLSDALPVVRPLLVSPLMQPKALECLKALCTCMEPFTAHLVPTLAACHLLIANQAKLRSEEKASMGTAPGGPATPASPLLEKFIQQVTEACLPEFTEERPLRPASFALIFPILQAVLDHPKSPQQAATALHVLSLHAEMPLLDDSSADEERAALMALRKCMIEAVLGTLARFKRLEPSPASVLAQLCSGVPLTSDEWEPLLGNLGLLSEEEHVRSACLEAMMLVASEDPEALQGKLLLALRLWSVLCSSHDADRDNAELASELWEESGLELCPAYSPTFLELLANSSAFSAVRECSGRALAAAAVQLPSTADAALTKLLELYERETPKVQPKEKELDMAKYFAKDDNQDDNGDVDRGWSCRSGVAQALAALGQAKALASPLLMFEFIVKEGLADKDDLVRGQMLQAGTAMISAYGDAHVGPFLTVCESVMEGKKLVAQEDEQRKDWRREGVVVLTGTAAKHLEKNDPKIESIAATLVTALSTPSEPVQRAVADCLAPLVKATPVLKEKSPELLKKLLEQCTTGAKYGDRRGAAYGLSAVVKGQGIASLRKEQIIVKLEEACKSSWQSKQGALCAFECMCERLGLLFEPYVITILPLLLKSFSDSNDHVRAAAQDAARAIMKNLSAHGVKLVLPSILESLSDNAWRTKQAAISLLGAMTYCAPKQLSSCLPQIVPRLSSAFGDTHPKVREASKQALEDIGSVIRNPEVAGLSMILMGALSDAKKTRDALQALLMCEFMHSIDAPSLALIVPVVQRGFKDRSAEAKRRAALIIGNMCTMISDTKDLKPYMDIILPGLKATLVDPIPDVRATSSKALGSLAKGMGEAQLPDLIPWLIDTLKADTSSSERSGGAQGLSEVLVALGGTRAEGVLTELLPLANHSSAPVREGLLWLLCFLPGSMGREFTPLIGIALPLILKGLSDEADVVREVSLRAGQVLVSTHGKAHAEKLLPALEAGLFDDNWRIRKSSVQLLGDLLCLLGDTKQVGLEEVQYEDNARGSHSAEAAIEQALGVERRNVVLASLYLNRSDTSAVVRQSTLQVWKTIVPQTPRALREILPILTDKVISFLACGNPDKRLVAGRTLGDIVVKLGDHVLPEIVPFLRKGLESGDEHMRQGVCLGLAEVFESATKRQVEQFIETLVPAVQEALCDPSEDVREQAAGAFQHLHRVVGMRAVEEVVPALVRELESKDNPERRERAVYGLKEVLKHRPRELLPYLVPKLVARPITDPHALALGALGEAAGASIHFHLGTIIPALISELAERDASETEESCSSPLNALFQVQKCAALVVSNVEEAGINWLCIEMTKSMTHDKAPYRQWSAWLVQQFLAGTAFDFSEYLPLLLKELMSRLLDTDLDVQQAVWAAMKAMNAKVPAEQLAQHLSFSRNVLASLISDAKHRKGGLGDGKAVVLPGLNMSKGLEPWLPMYQHGLMYGSPEIREAAATGIGELVDVTTPKFLQPFIIKITGPLIRIVGDRFPAPVKAAILNTLALLLGKGGPFLKPFVPQLQTTFVKALSDPSRIVRQKGATALALLMGLSTRVDPLITELVSGSSGDANPTIKVTMLNSLASVLERAGKSASAGTISQASSTLLDLLHYADEGVREAGAAALAGTLEWLPAEEATSLVRDGVIGMEVLHGAASRQGRALALGKCSSCSAVAKEQE